MQNEHIGTINCPPCSVSAPPAGGECCSFCNHFKSHNKGEILITLLLGCVDAPQRQRQRGRAGQTGRTIAAASFAVDIAITPREQALLKWNSVVSLPLLLLLPVTYRSPFSACCT